MALLKGLGPHITTLCGLFSFLPYLPYQVSKLPYHLYKRHFREESIELFLFGDGLEEAHCADIRPQPNNIRFLPYLPYQVPKLSYQHYKM